MNSEVLFKSGGLLSLSSFRQGFINLLCVIILTIMGSSAAAFRLDEQIAPPVTIKGKVVTDTGEPLTGVTVSLKGSALTTRTDQSGNYSLDVPVNEGTLVFFLCRLPHSGKSNR